MLRQKRGVLLQYLAWHLVPCLVREVRVNGAGDDLTVVLGKLLGHVGEGDELGGTDKGEIEWVEEETDPLALGGVLLQRDLLEGAVHRGLAGESGRRCGHLGVGATKG